MAAPIGNQFWKLRSKHGRDKLFATPDLLWEAACEYFEWCDNNPEHIVEQKKGNTSIKSIEGMAKEDISSLFDSVVYLPTKIPYTIHGLCLYLGCNTEYFCHFEESLKDKTDEMSKDFSQIVTRIRETIYHQKYVGAACGYFNQSIIARDLSLVDNSNVNIKGIPQITGLEVK